MRVAGRCRLTPRQDHVLVKGASWVLELSFGDGPRRQQGLHVSSILTGVDGTRDADLGMGAG